MALPLLLRNRRIGHDNRRNLAFSNAKRKYWEDIGKDSKWNKDIPSIKV